MAISEVPAFTIRELGGRRRAITLVARGLPYRPLTLEGEQRVKITNPAGNPIGYGTVMGSMEGETQIEGFWKDKYLNYSTAFAERPGQAPIILVQPRTPGANGGALGNFSPGTSGTPVTSVVDAISLLDSVRTEGQLLEVQWGYVIRRGYLKKLSQKWHNIHDCEWSANFAWVSKDRVPESPEFGPPAGQREIGSNLRSLLRNALRIIDTPRALMSEYMQEYRNFLNRIADASYSIDQSVTGLIDEASPIRAASEIQTTLGGIAQTAFNIKDKTEADGWAGVFEDYRRAIPFGSYIGTSSGSAESRFAAAEQAALDALDPEEVMKAQLYVRETVSDLRRVQDETEARRRYFEATPERALGLYRAREGDDLRYVSQLYYGTPTQWRALMLFNGLDTTELYPGQTITIPRIDQPEDEAQL
jgi:hypothetical protein